jgi:hypothetical protein
MEPAEGFEPPMISALQVRRNRPSYATPAKGMEPVAGIEPAAFRLRGGCYYQTELHGHGAASRDRTDDLFLTEELFYQLNYHSENGWEGWDRTSA